jgi:hypothetical protein
MGGGSIFLFIFMDIVLFGIPYIFTSMEAKDRIGLERVESHRADRLTDG